MYVYTLQKHFFKKTDCWIQRLTGDDNTFYLQFCDRHNLDPEDRKFFIIDLESSEDTFRLGDHRLAKTNGVFTY